MRALVLARHGPPERAFEVRELPDPPVGPGQVRIRVRTAGVNFADIAARVGLYPDAPKPPCVLGYEVAGEVDAVGPDVEGVAPGGRVLAMTRFNGFAELVTTGAESVLPLPDGLGFEEGAALPVNYGTAYAAVALMAAVRTGERVLLRAAAGGVGIAALQLLADRGAEVIAVASGGKHGALRDQGAAHAIDYRTQDVAAEVRRITDGKGVDVALDPLGEFRESYALLRAGGRLVMYGLSSAVTGDRRSIPRALKAVAAVPRFGAIRLMNENKAVMGLNLLHWWDERGSLEELIRPLLELVEQGVVKPVIAATYPLERVADAHRLIQERGNVGKVVLTLG